ncbi:MAG: hypothetical protein SNJ71_06630 [Bacteroidales bacterium]
MTKLFFISLLIGTLSLYGQKTDSITTNHSNIAENLLNEKQGLTIGGYGEIHYNQPLTSNKFDLGTVDAHRLVMFLGYNFSNKTQFVSEIEFEYAKELWVEQMFIQHKLNKFINFRAGILLIPMGIINEYHEPTTFNGVERPIIDNRIVPSTWREIGLGFQGNLHPIKSRYQAYLVNGFNGYDGKTATFSGSKALREGRQKGSKAYIYKPAFSGKIEYYGIKNLTLGVSGYYGDSHSRLYGGLHKDSSNLIKRADSSIVGISMIGADARYSIAGVKLTGQFYFTSISNTEQYNVFTAVKGKPNDLGSAMIGYYAEIGYNIFKTFENIKTELMPFVRYEVFNTHHAVKNPIQKNKAYNNLIITSGLTYTLTKNVVLKSDIQFQKSEIDKDFSKVFNAGFGVMF